MLMGSLECVGITTALVENHGFCFFFARFRSNSASRVSGVDNNKNV